MDKTNISDAEWHVMQIVWEKNPVTAAGVIDALRGVKKWDHRTIRTLLARLVDKGVLAAQADGNRNLYRPLVSRDKCVRAESQSFLQKVFGGSAAELLVHFVRAGDITAQQIEELKRLLDGKRRKP